MALLRQGKLSEIDALNVAEELGDVGKSELWALESAISLLIMHLLKWDRQPARRSRSWQAPIDVQRLRIGKLIRRNPGLKSKIADAIEENYPEGRAEAVRNTDLPYEAFPDACPYTFDEMMSRPIEFEPQPRRRRKVSK